MMPRLFALALAAGLFGIGCAHGPRPIQSDSTLGQVIVYRNGVAYFERYAEPNEDAIRLRVPAERVDDFLKSLSIVDDKSGKALPVSYPTMSSSGGYVEMTIALPKPHGRLRITYVTESPAWKPSYRVVLGKEGEATLMGWAVIDNVSGEDWDKVRIGVGSTSALSFRYDLRSIRLVERETLGTGELLASAPPTGGSPYAVATKKVRVIGKLSQGDLGGIAAIDTETQARFAHVQPDSSREPEAERKERHSRQQQQARGPEYYRSLASQLKSGKHRVRIEGYAQPGDRDPGSASLARANQVRDQLVQHGVPAGHIDVQATGRFNATEAVRIVDTGSDEHAQGAHELDEGRAGDTQPVGHAMFLSRHAMSIESEHSAMVSILNDKTAAKQVYYYDPVSPRGNKQFAFNAVRIENPSQYTLDAGPFTVYADGQFLGEGLSDPILPGASAFIPYALDRSVVAEAESGAREEIERLLTSQRGIVNTETRRIRRTKLSLSNRGKQDAEVYVRHRVESGYRLTDETKARAKVEKLDGAYLLSVTVPAGEALELEIEESTPLLKTVDIHTPQGVEAMRLFLSKERIEPALRDKLDAIVKRYTESANLQERIEVLNEQTRVYQTRVNEINVQLATLRKVPQAAKLQRHLTEKMEEISNRLQQATMDLTDLQGRMMTLRIDLQDRLAELTFESPAEAEKVAQKP